MPRLLLGGLTAAALLTVSACGSGASDAEPSDSQSEPSTEPTTEPSMSDEELAGIVADVPKDVKWHFDGVPSTWQRLEAEDGVAQWQVADRCVVTMYQPSGLGNDTEPTRDQVLEKYRADTESAMGTSLKVSDSGTRRFPVITNKDAKMSTQLSRAHLTGADEVEGEILAYRSGDFALALTMLCSKDLFAKVNASDFEPFLDQVSVAADY